MIVTWIGLPTLERRSRSQSAEVLMESAPTLRITSNALNPAAAASLLRATCLTIKPPGTPRYSDICEVSGSTSAPTLRVLVKRETWKPLEMGASEPAIPIVGGGEAGAM